MATHYLPKSNKLIKSNQIYFNMKEKIIKYILLDSIKTKILKLLYIEL